MANNSKTVRDFVGKKIYTLMNREESYVRATLAKLRRGVGKHPGSMPDIWDFTLMDLPEELLSKSGEPTSGEWAAHLSLSLFALHQQSHDIRQKPMSATGGTLGSAVRTLVIKRGEASEDAIKRRFNMVVTSDNPEELAHHLRGLIQLLRSESISLDYPRLAEDLYWFQLPDWRDGIRLRWGQDYYSYNRKDEEKDEK